MPLSFAHLMRIWYNMTPMKIFLSLFAVVLAGTVLAEKQPLERYQSIIDRRPFGQPPPGYDPDSMALDPAAAAAAMTPEQLSQEQEQLQRSVGFSVMNINSDGSVSVGFSDQSNPKQPAHYYLREGETRDGWHVKSVDIHEQAMVLDKEGVEITLHLGDSAKPDAKGGRGGRGGASGGGAGGFNRMGQGGRSGLLGARTFPGAGGGDGNAPASYASRRQRREQEAAALEKQRADQEAERKRLAEESEAKAAEEKAAREEERAATRQQLQAIQEELRKARDEARQREQQGSVDEGNDS